MLVRTAVVLLLASLGVASPWHLRGAEDVPALFRRQDAVENDPSCTRPCDLDTCGRGACGIRSTGLTRRSFDDISSLVDTFGSINITSSSDSERASELEQISKRIWRFDATSSTPIGDSAPTQNEVDAYLPAVFNGAENAYFGAPATLFYLDERAVSQQREITPTTGPFQIMTGGIHGCTTVALISNRGVWMAHFWESYSHGKPNEDSPATMPDFVDRILKFIRGEKVTKPAPSTYKPYIQPRGPFINNALFTRNDNVRFFISTPIADGATLGRRPKLKYALRVPEIEREITRKLGFEPEITRVPYQRLDYSDPAQEALENQSARGMHLFQYDNDSDGKGQRAWRLFMEARYQMERL